MIPDRIEGLLAKARQTFVNAWGDEINAYFDRETDHMIFGPGYSPGYPKIRFSSIRVLWSELVEALAAVGLRSERERPRSPQQRGWYKGLFGASTKCRLGSPPARTVP
jgi:hypothetical protein